VKIKLRRVRNLTTHIFQVMLSKGYYIQKEEAEGSHSWHEKW